MTTRSINVIKFINDSQLIPFRNKKGTGLIFINGTYSNDSLSFNDLQNCMFTVANKDVESIIFSPYEFCEMQSAIDFRDNFIWGFLGVAIGIFAIFLKK